MDGVGGVGDLGVSRRRAMRVLAAGAAGLAGSRLLPDAARGLLAPTAARALPGRAGRVGQAAPATTVKPLPDEWFVVHGTNAEMRWDTFPHRSFLVPNERFFVRNHTSTPLIDAETWRLRLFGTGLAVDGPVELSYDDLLSLPAHTITSTIECAGNGRSFFGSQQGTPAGGTPWKLGGIGAARWRGARLADVLDRAGVLPSAVSILPEGLDATVLSGGVDQGHVRRPLPIEKALDDVLVAYEMNGQPLPPDHGFPARLVVPGWVGIASIKWLGQIEVSDRPLASPWSTTWYRLTGPTYPPDSPPLTTQPVKSALELAWDAPLPDGRRVVLRGRSWSGEAPVHRVEVSVDGGRRWRRARLDRHDAGRTWARWQLPWTPRQPGAQEVLVRAADRSGLTQPDSVPFNDGGYQFWAVVRHPVTVA